jgi:hypothetical protein
MQQVLLRVQADLGLFRISDLTSFDHTIQHPSCGTYHVWSGRDFGGAGDYRSKFLADIPWVLN